jgi:hypothetical protein
MLMRICLLFAAVACSLPVVSFAQEPAKKPDAPIGAKPVKTREEAEKEFSELLTNAQLVGYFTTDGDTNEKPLKEDRYSIAQVKKVEGDKEDRWLMTYLYKGSPLPLILPVKWAGTTPVITLDDLTIPGMGTFSARVMFHGDRYAGTWQHGKKGGLMFGRIEQPGKAKPAEVDKPKPSDEPVKK